MINSPNRLISKPNNNSGFSLIEVLLAIGILGGTILCLLSLFTPVLAKARSIETRQSTKNIEEKMNAFIQSRPFNEVFYYTKANQCFYFYNDDDNGNGNDRQRVTFDINEIRDGLTGSIIKVTLSASNNKDDNHLILMKPEDYPEAYLEILVRIYNLKSIHDINKKQRSVSSFTTIKNR